MRPWLRDLRHDLIKHGLFCARDLRDLGIGDTRPPTPAERAALHRGLLELADDEGGRVTAAALFADRRAAHAADAAPAALDTFAAAIATAEAAVTAQITDPDPACFRAALHAVLHLEDAFAALCRDLDAPLAQDLDRR